MKNNSEEFINSIYKKLKYNKSPKIDLNIDEFKKFISFLIKNNK